MTHFLDLKVTHLTSRILLVQTSLTVPISTGCGEVRIEIVLNNPDETQVSTALSVKWEENYQPQVHTIKSNEITHAMA